MNLPNDRSHTQGNPPSGSSHAHGDPSGRPTERPSGRTASNSPATRGEQPEFNGDYIYRPTGRSSVPIRRRAYTTSAHAQEVRDRLSERDLAIIQTLGMVAVASSQHLESLHFDGLSASSRPRQRSNVLNRLTKLKLVARLPRNIGGVRSGSSGYIFVLDLLGQRLLGRRKIRKPPSQSWSYLKHFLAITDLFVSVVESERDGRLELRRFVTEPHCWNLIEGEVNIRPDAIVTVKPAVGDWIDHWAVEVDRATERPIRIREKLLHYHQAYQGGGVLRGSKVFPKVLLTVPDEQRLEECLRVIERLPLEAAELVVPVLHDQAAQVLASGGPT